MAEDINMISFAHDSSMSLPDRVKICLHCSTLPHQILPQSDLPLLI